MNRSGGDAVANFREMFAQMLSQDEAGLFASTVGENPPVRYVTLDLTTAKLAGAPMELSFGFRSFVVLNTTDSSVSIRMRIGSRDTNVDSFPVKNNASLVLPYPVQKAFLDWDAQSGKSISILFFTRGVFSTNQLVSSLAAVVTLGDGDTADTQNGAQVLAAGGQLFAADSARKCMLIENQSGQPIYIGSSVVDVPGGAQPGFTIQDGGTYEWRSTAACYAISATDTAATGISLTKFS